MKTYSKKHIRMIIALACISLVFAVLVVILIQRYALINNGDDTKSVPTKPIGKNQSVGGQVDESQSRSNKSSKSNSLGKNGSSDQSESTLRSEEHTSELQSQSNL